MLPTDFSFLCAYRLSFLWASTFVECNNRLKTSGCFDGCVGICNMLTFSCWIGWCNLCKLTSLYSGPLEFLFFVDSTEDPTYHGVSRLVLDFKGMTYPGNTNKPKVP